MHVTLYMAMSANGMIAKPDDDTDWIPQTEWDSYSATVRSAGYLVVGRRTYEILTKQSGFSEFSDVTIVTVSNHTPELVAPHHRIARSPKEALDLLASFETVIVAGGGILNAAFLAENLVDEIVLDIEPVLLGRGIPFFAGEDFERKLKLIESRKLSDHEIQFRYQVCK